eukprot:m.36272 g.36272  ORF g.36272 m.36272 type:complete len:55 (-) comp5380_c0_seq2:349-513(-)
MVLPQTTAHASMRQDMHSSSVTVPSSIVHRHQQCSTVCVVQLLFSEKMHTRNRA